MQTFIPTLLSSGWHINEVMHEWMSGLVNFFIIVLEFMGLVVLVYTAIKAFIQWMKKNPHARLNLESGLTNALSFMLGGEILKTLVVHNMEEILQVGAIMILRAALTFLIHWEIKNEEHEMEEKEQKETHSAH